MVVRAKLECSETLCKGRCGMWKPSLPGSAITYIWMAVCVVFVAGHCAAGKRLEQELRGRVVAIADGDTFTLLGPENQQYKIRMQGIDAPEKRQAFGSASKKSLSDKIFQSDVRILWKSRDKYGRLLGEVYLGDRHINLEQVSDGMAWWYVEYAPSAKDLKAAEQRARKDSLGLWKDVATTTPPIPPWEWRKQEKQAVPKKTARGSSR